MQSFLKLSFLLFLAAIAECGAQSINAGFSPAKGDHIIILGNTFADRMRHYGYFEALLQKNFSGRELTVRNMGWSADELGLQPRPLNFPGFGEKEKRLTEGQKEVRFQGFTHEGEPITMPVALNFQGLNQDLYDQKADVIFLCFGMNEAFKGPAGLAQFEKDLNIFIQNLLKNNYNTRSAPKLVLVSPIAHEALGGNYPDPGLHNQNLRIYTRAMQKAAQEKGIFFIDLFTPSQAKMNAPGAPALTINGIHLNDQGYRLAAEWMADALGFGNKRIPETESSKKLLAVIKMKDSHFFYRWRAVNGEYIYGRRREPFGVIAFPPELRKLNQMTTSLDSVIWDLGKSNGTEAFARAIAIVDQRGKPADPMLATDIPMTGRQGDAAKAAAHAHHGTASPAATSQFKLPEGYAINLFASEQDFPVEKPVAMNFDAKGRLWVATMPTYPQYYPGIPVHDKIVILEDTDADGKADKHTVFADDLYLPLGFEFGNGGVYVSQEPDILFLKDTDGDGKADLREVILTGFGSEDSHHATHAFTFGQDGALYFNEGTFLNTQVETPYGPIRSYAGATYRFEPRTGKLFHYISYPYYNPWGSVFDRWGMHLIGDASDGSNYFAPPMTGNVTYPDKHPRIEMFTETRVRPTAGIEIISSRQFPDEVQGDFLVNNNIGFQGTKQHRILPRGSGIGSKEVEPILQSSDPNYRPIDIEFGPDGALYIVDWYNPLISHGENPPRDPARDKSHGRIWRITYKKKPVMPVTDVSGQSVQQLLENLKAYEDRFRYRSRAQIREKPAGEVLPELRKWAAGLDKNDPQYEHHLLEALWLFQDFNVPETGILKTLLHASEPKARAAATKVLLYWRDRIPNSLEMMQERLNDESPRVRIEAIVALSYFEPDQALRIAADIFKYPTDYYLDYAISETFRFLKPAWLTDLRAGKSFGKKADHYLTGLTTPAELLSLPPTSGVLAAILTRPGIDLSRKKEAVDMLAEKQHIGAADVLVHAIVAEDKVRKDTRISPGQKELTRLLLTRDASYLKKQEVLFKKMISPDSSLTIRSIGYAALISAGNFQAEAPRNPADAEAFLTGITLLDNKELRASFYENVKNLAARSPAVGYPLLMTMTIENPEKTQPVSEFIASLARLPDTLQNSAAFGQAVDAMKSKVSLLPENERKTALSALEKLGTIELTIKAVEAKMAFDKTLLNVPAGRAVTLVFENPDLMPHNVVIVKPGTLEKVGQAADAMATLKDGFEKNFVPATADVLFATPLVNSGKTFRLEFKAPAQPGAYPFICSFPGHWRVMQGILQVTASESP